MSIKKQYRSDISASIHQAASALYDVKAIDKKTMSDFDKSCLKPIKPLQPEQIKALREREHMSQPVFALYLNVSKGLVSEWERGVKKPSGAASRLLDVVKRHGIDALL